MSVKRVPDPRAVLEAVESGVGPPRLLFKTRGDPAGTHLGGVGGTPPPGGGSRRPKKIGAAKKIHPEKDQKKFPGLRPDPPTHPPPPPGGPTLKRSLGSPLQDRKGLVVVVDVRHLQKSKRRH